MQPGGGLLSEVFSGTTLTLSRSFTTIIILFFLLSSGDRLLRGLVEVMPRFQEKRQVVEIAAEIEENISAYLLTISLMNALVGVATGLAMWLCGLPNPLLWGTAAFLLNYIPILGPLDRRRHVLRGRSRHPALAMAGPAAGRTLSADPYRRGRDHHAHAARQPVHAQPGGGDRQPVLLARDLGRPRRLSGRTAAATAKIICDRVAPLQPLGHIVGS